VSLAEASLLAAGGLVAGVVNTLAGGGSILTVPLLVLTGLPGTLANGTNRVGILVQNTMAAWSFRREGVSGLRDAWPVLVPVALGSLVGALWVSRLAAETFERVFGVVMLLLLVPTLGSPRRAPHETPPRPWPAWLSAFVFLGIGLYGGSVQAGVGLVLVMALSRAGFDLVRANSIKVVVIAVLAVVAVPVFIAARQVVWAPALVLAAGYAAGGALGARIAVRGGERLIRPVMALAVLAMAGRMLRLY
jgi:uncharacterized membrane protein YfcA